MPEIILDSPISLWFDNQGHEAALFYVSLLPNSCIEKIVSPNRGRPPLVVEFTLGGTPYMVLNGGPQFEHTEAASISVLTEDQDETDRLWDALIAGGGRAGQCGWLKDRFGVSWQIVPQTLPRLLSDTDRTEPPIAALTATPHARISNSPIPPKFTPPRTVTGESDAHRRDALPGARPILDDRRSLMSYIQGFLVAVPTKNKDAYRDMAAKSAEIFEEYGATRIVECWGDSVPDGKVTDSKRAVKAKDDETVVFAWIEWPDKATYEAAATKMETDERWKAMPEMPFDGKRMMWAGFEPLFESGS